MDAAATLSASRAEFGPCCPPTLISPIGVCQLFTAAIPFCYIVYQVVVWVVGGAEQWRLFSQDAPWLQCKSSAFSAGPQALAPAWSLVLNVPTAFLRELFLKPIAPKTTLMMRRSARLKPAPPIHLEVTAWYIDG
jgi:hypothetical protein